MAIVVIVAIVVIDEGDAAGMRGSPFAFLIGLMGWMGLIG